jgi:hypothetical protein
MLSLPVPELLRGPGVAVCFVNVKHGNLFGTFGDKVAGTRHLRGASFLPPYPLNVAR